MQLLRCQNEWQNRYKFFEEHCLMYVVLFQLVIIQVKKCSKSPKYRLLKCQNLCATRNSASIMAAKIKSASVLKSVLHSLCDGTRNFDWDQDQGQDQKFEGTRTKDWDQFWSGTGTGTGTRTRSRTGTMTKNGTKTCNKKKKIIKNCNYNNFQKLKLQEQNNNSLNGLNVDHRASIILHF